MMTPFARILQKKLRNMSASEKRALCEAISRRAGDDLQFTWALNGRDDQLPPDALCDDANWLVWLLLGGRGAGKTRAGAEWVRARAMGNVSGGLAPARRIALVGPTFAEARSVMVEGVSGVLAVHRDHERPKYEASLKRLHWRNGAVAQLFSAEDPDSLRGPQFDAAWCDELCKWKYAEKTWDMLQFALRLGTRPRQVVTTTPRPVPLLKKLLEAEGTMVSKSRTYDNTEHLSQEFLTSITERYGGTRLGRQELEAELLDDNGSVRLLRAHSLAPISTIWIKICDN
jgi:phage terminase large subunit-like protein